MRLISLGLVAAATVAYAPGLTSPFTQYDDNLYVTRNLPQLTPGGWAGLALQWDDARAWSGEFVEFFPLRDTVYWALYQGFELNPVPFHLASLAFHLAATLLLFELLLRLRLPLRGAAFGALLFALHPVHIESVVWIAGLKDPMYSAFMFLGLVAYARYREAPTPGLYALTLAGLVLALLVKSMAIAMPALMLAMELLVGQRARWDLIVKRLAGPTLITLLFLLRFVAIGKANAIIVGPHGGTWFNHAVLALFAQAKYLKQTLLPTSFRLIYCFEPPTGWGDWRLWAGLAVVLGLVGLFGFFVARGRPLHAFFVAWYVAALLPVSNLLPFPAIMADRYLYAASAGACGLLGLLVARLRTGLYVMVVVVSGLLLTATTASRSWLWNDEEVLWQEPDEEPACLVDSSFPAAQAHVLRFLSTHDDDTRMRALERALASPGFPRVGPDVACYAMVSAAKGALLAGELPRAIWWTKTVNRECPIDADGWNVAAAINVETNPAVAAMAAQKSWRLRKTPSAETLMWLTQLRIAPGSPGSSALVRLARETRDETCPQLVAWSLQFPDQAPRIAEAVSVCVAQPDVAPAEPAPTPGTDATGP